VRSDQQTPLTSKGKNVLISGTMWSCSFQGLIILLKIFLCIPDVKQRVYHQLQFLKSGSLFYDIL
jgi:hypothetical protein